MIYNIHIFIDIKCFTGCSKRKTGRSNTASVKTESFAMPAGRRKPHSLEKGLLAVQRYSSLPGDLEGSQSRAERVRGKKVGPAVSHFPGWPPGWWKAVISDISGEAKKPGGHAGGCLEDWSGLTEDIEEAKRKSSLYLLHNCSGGT